MIEKNCVEAQLALCRLLIDEQHEGRVKIKFVCFFFKWNDILFTYEFKIMQGQSQGRIIYLFRMESILFILENFL